MAWPAGETGLRGILTMLDVSDSAAAGMAEGAPLEVRSKTKLPKPKFNGSDRFLRELRRRVDAYFESTGRKKRDCPQMYFKTATILEWFPASYLCLLFVATSWWSVIPLAILLG